MRTVMIDDGRVVVGDRPVPAPGPGEVLVRVAGAGLNRADLLQRAGRYPAPSGIPADVPGLEFSGVVERCGPGESEHAGVGPGDAVFGITGGGAQAEYVAVPAGQCTRVPAGVEIVAAGGVPEAFVTAHDALVTQAELTTGEWVLVHAVGSGVGTAAVQLVKALGGRVAGTARTADKLERCRSLGLDAAVHTPIRDGVLDVEALTAAIVAATDGGPDVTLDLVGGSYVEADVAAAAIRGRIVLVGALAGAKADLSVLALMGKRLRLFGTVLRARSVDEKTAAVQAFGRDVVEPLLATGAVTPVVDELFPIEEAARAYDRLASDATFGKLVLDCT